jgi:hypothetical protein
MNVISERVINGAQGRVAFFHGLYLWFVYVNVIPYVGGHEQCE